MDGLIVQARAAGYVDGLKVANGLKWKALGKTLPGKGSEPQR